MANFLSKIRVKTAVEKTNQMTMKADHLTTADFGQFNVVKVVHLPPLCKGKIKLYTFSNMQPLPQPTFGEVVYRNAWYWVPYRTIFRGWNDFITDNMHVGSNANYGKIDEVPYIKNSTLVTWLMNQADNATSTDFDFAVRYGNTTTYHNHNSETKIIWKLLCSIGAKPLMDLGNHKHISMLGILGILRVYMDYYYTNAYKGDSEYILGMSMLNRDNGNLEYDLNAITNIFTEIRKLYYETNYFTGCWDQPNHPNIVSQEGSYQINDPNGTYGMTYEASNRVQNEDENGAIRDPYIQPTDEDGSADNVPAPINQWAMNTVKALTDYLKRHQLAGADVIQRYAARFGIRLNDEQLRKATRLKEDSWTMQVSPIFSNADTAAQGGESLGSYAGQAYAESSKEFWTEFETKEYGMLIAINTIQPVETYPNGFDAMNDCLTRLDFWTPEFDNIGVDAVTAAELNVANTGAAVTMGGKAGTNTHDKVFGFLPRYARWKTMKDCISGDYTIERWRNIYEAYSMQRKISEDSALNTYVHSKGFVTEHDVTQFDRIFYAQSGNKGYDNFNLIHQLTLEMETKMKPLYDYYDWEHENGKEIEIQNNGPYAR